MPDSESLTRRRFLGTTGVTTAVVGFAGCLGDDDDDPDDLDDSASDADDPDDTGDPGDDDDDTTGDEEPGGVLRIGWNDGPRTIDPIRHMGSTAAAITRRMFDSLYTYDEGVGFVPQLAALDEPEVSREGTRWVIEIEEDAVFHNGDPVTAGDVEYTMTQPIVEERGDASRYQMIEEFTLVDDKTVQIDLEYPFARFMLPLTDHIVPGDVREEHKNGSWTDNIVGSGPFRFVEWTEEEEVVLEAWDEYWGGQSPAVDEVVFREVEEPSTRITTLQTDENDLIYGIPDELQNTVENMDNAEFDFVEGIRVNYLAFNCNDGPTADPLVREAIDYCVDMDREVEFFVEGAGSRIYADMPPILTEEWEFPTDEWAEIPHERDVDRARDLFEEAGVPDDWEATILTWDEVHQDIGLSVAAGIEEAGYDAQVHHLEWGTFVSQFNTGDADDMNLYLLSSAGEPDPGRYLYTRHHKDRWGADNGHYYDNEEMFQKIEEGDRTTDVERRRELYTDVQTTILEERVHLPMYVSWETFAYQSHVEDVKLHPVPTINPRISSPFNNISLRS